MESTLRVEDVKKMKVSDLKRELKVRSLSTTGSKEKLIARLEEEIETENVALDDDNVEESGNVEDLGEDDDLLAGSTANTNDLKDNDNNKAEIKDEEVKNVSGSADNSEEKNVTTKPISEAERKAARAARFNIPTSPEEAAKKEARAKRFGIEESSTTSTIILNPEEHLDKLKKRGERFGVSVSPTMQKIDQVDRLLKRKEKFGAASVAGGDLESRKKMRAERFGVQ
ncbi:SAP domain-containing ribonucleoprotein [Trichoplax sp. H2]|nr:SAP domain-containing ribonucleoprotein [Trichoplax sp. H2]|eukprot:RDD42790.1 SAP domain-containing ribonucleoprotein [Trichoplax sp. H2]